MGGAIFAITQAALDANPNDQGEPGSLPTVTTTGTVNFSGSTAAQANSQTGTTGANGVGANQDNLDIFGTITAGTPPDTTRPTVTINIVDTLLSDSDNSSNVTFAFSEAVTGFTKDDLTVAGGSISGFNGSGANYSATFTATDDSTTDGKVTVNANSYTDAAGNAGAAGNDTVTVDTTNPTVTVNIVDASLSDSDNNSVVNFTFSEAVTGFDASDLTVAGGSISGFSGSGANYSATFTATDNSTTDGKVTVNANSYTDAAGNAGAAGSDTVTVDTVNPTVTSFTRKTPTVGTTDADTLTFQATFDEAVQNVDQTDFKVNGTTANITKVTGTGDTRTITVSGGDLATLNGTVSLDLDAKQNITDTAGNALPAGEPATDEAYQVANANLAFSQATYTSNEGDGTSNVVTVTRAITTGTASVEIALQGKGSTATVGSDYTDPGFPLTVNFADGEASQTVDIGLIDDNASEGNETLVLSLQNPTGGDLGTQTTTTLTIVDNDSPGFTIVESGGTTQVDESGTTDTFTVVLNAQPLSDVELEIFSNTKTKSKVPDEATFTPTTLTFTAADWNKAQTVTVTGVDDDLDDGDQTTTLSIGVVDGNSDDAFDNLKNQTVTITTVDDDTAGITLVQSGGSTAVTEGGTTDTYTVVLDSQPTDAVTIALKSGKQVQVDQKSVTFTTTNWDQAQTVTVSAIDDTAIEGNHTGTIAANVISKDDNYDDIKLGALSVAVTDNDIQTVNLAVSTNSGAEAEGTTITVTATADDAVSGDQTLTLNVAGLNLTPEDYRLSDSVLTILNGQTTATTTFTIVDDALSEGAETALLSLSNPSAGLLLGTTTKQAIAIADNDNNGIFNFEQWVSLQTIRTGQTYQSTVVDFNIEVGGLRLAPLFDETDYLNDNPDVAAAVQQGVYNYGFEHFVLFGIKEGRAPSDWFDADYYLAQNADVAAAVSRGETTAIEHFLLFGHLENRDPSAAFDASDYLLNNPDVKAAVDAGLIDSAFEHYLESGAEEGRQSGLLFDESFYLAQNLDVAAAVQTGAFALGLYHFLSFGQVEGRDPSAAFDQSAYLANNGDVAAAVAAGGFASGFEHYVLFGRAEGRVAV
ncbi:MAG: Ig-like domain-containing protein [Cyanobacteria bacterium P01_A01_bin.70]